MCTSPYWRTLDPTPPLQSHWLHFTAQSWGSPSWSSLAICLAVCIRWTGVSCKLWGGQSCEEVCSLHCSHFTLHRVDVSIISFSLLVYNVVEPVTETEFLLRTLSQNCLPARWCLGWHEKTRYVGRGCLLTTGVVKACIRRALLTISYLLLQEVLCLHVI